MLASGLPIPTKHTTAAPSRRLRGSVSPSPDWMLMSAAVQGSTIVTCTAVRFQRASRQPLHLAWQFLSPPRLPHLQPALQSSSPPPILTQLSLPPNSLSSHTMPTPSRHPHTATLTQAARGRYKRAETCGGHLGLHEDRVSRGQRRELPRNRLSPLRCCTNQSIGETGHRKASECRCCTHRQHVTRNVTETVRDSNGMC